MTTRNLKLLALAVAALAVAGCGSGGYGGGGQAYSPPAPAPAPPPPTGESFTNWSKKDVFAKPADGAPEIMDQLVFNFDGNDNPDAYSDLLPPG